MKKFVIAVLVLIIAAVCCALFVLIRNVSNTVSQISSQSRQDLGTLSPLQTAAAYGYTPVPKGQLSVVSTRVSLEALQWFVFTDENVDGQPALIAKLTTEGEKHYPGVGNSFTGVFLGDPNNLSQIKITILRTEKREGAINSGTWLIKSILLGPLAALSDEETTFWDWLDENFLTMSIGGEQEKIINNVQYVLQRPETDLILLTITPQK